MPPAAAAALLLLLLRPTTAIIPLAPLLMLVLLALLSERPVVGVMGDDGIGADALLPSDTLRPNSPGIGWVRTPSRFALLLLWPMAGAPRRAPPEILRLPLMGADIGEACTLSRIRLS